MPAPPPKPLRTASVNYTGDALKLAEAVDRRDADKVRRLIHDEGVDPNGVFSDHGLPIVAWPVLNRNPEGLRLLLDNGADPNARRSRPDGRPINNAMIYAAQEPDQRLLTMLLDHGGDPNAENANGEALTFVAWLRDQWPNVQLLVLRGADVNYARNSGGDDTIAAWYARLGDFEQVYWLLQHGADPTVKMKGVPGVSEDRMPILESIYYMPVKPGFVEWQQKCQRWLRERGITRPPIPAFLKERRKSLGLPSDEKDIPQA